MILLQLTIDGNTRYVSRDGHALDHYWSQKIISFTAPTQKTPVDHGGYCQMEFGGVVLSPDLFYSPAESIDDWPPPAEIDWALYHTATTEAAKELLGAGKGHLSAIAQDGVSYDLCGPTYTATASGGTSYNATLATIAGAMCATLGLALDSTAARSPSPTVVHTLDSDRLLVDVLSDFCAFYTHLYYIQAGTLYLIDMLADNGSRSLDDFDFFSPTYTRRGAVAEVTDGTWAAFSGYSYGSSVSQDAFHDTQANIEAALADIADVLNRPWADVPLPFSSGLPVPGEKVTIVDTMLAKTTTTWLRVRRMQYNLDKDEVIVSGEGGMS